MVRIGLAVQLIVQVFRGSDPGVGHWSHIIRDVGVRVPFAEGQR